ncbi:hypothetical protein RDI58_020196 [Solanum bulbocastanum]|uniref:RNase H type-1 domain-containing protein n=1 Tax=Solanum bulbocastanum TaxID=147425 RepID=A0AAN8T8A0_SOLBU
MAKRGKGKEVIKWEPPDRGLKLNIDGSFDPTTKAGGAEGVIRDRRGNWVKGFSAKINVNNALSAELHSLLLGLKMAKQIHSTKLHINTDSLEVINIIAKETDTYSNIIFECRVLLQHMRSLVISHSRRKQNQLADILAKKEAGLKQDVNFLDWIETPCLLWMPSTQIRRGLLLLESMMIGRSCQYL